MCIAQLYFGKERHLATFGKFEINPTSNVMECIMLIKSKERFTNSIHDFGDFPFHVVFCSPEQIDLWKTAYDANEKTSVSMDAAGRFVKRIHTSAETSSHMEQ